jgi:signal transduction histidine kinase/CheY-like chemotaxis protein
MVVLGALWGIASWIYMDLRFPPSAICLIALVAGMSAAALAIFSTCLPVAVGFFLPAILPVWWVFLATKNIYYLPMFLGVPLYLLVLLIFALNHSRVARRSIQLRFENSALVQQLRQQTSRTEQALHHAEEANRAKLVFLASASHDLRQPMHALCLFLGALQRTELNRKQRELLDHVEASASASCEMLNTLLDFSKLEAGVIKARAQSFQLMPILHKLDTEFAPQANGKDLVFRLHETTASAYGDPRLIELILRNLISNAIRYTEQGGVLVGCRRCGVGIAIEIWDTGMGIPPEHLQSVFREFHQLDNPERDRQKGLGLGLAIVKGLAHTMNLPVILASRVGRGSVFRVELPAARLAEAPEDETVALPEAFDMQGLRILVIDDDRAIRSAMHALFSSWGCQVVTVETGQEALDSLADFIPRLLIVDYRLRGKQCGLQVLQAIHDHLGYALAAIIMTGDTAPDRIRDAQNSGATLLHKPVDIDIMRTTIEQLLLAHDVGAG